MKGGRCFLVACAASLAWSACSQAEDHDRLAAAIDNVRPYASRFVSFESWARRAYSVADPAASDRALSEILFAPARQDRGLLATWIRLGVSPERIISLPPSIALPDTRRQTDVRDPVLGWVSVARFQRCPIETERARRSADQPQCVIISRVGTSLDERQPQVTMAFAVPDAD